MNPVYKADYGTKEDYEAFCETVKKIESINPEAADILRSGKGLIRLTRTFDMNTESGLYYDGDISCCFLWSRSYKGSKFWSDIHNALLRGDYNV